MTPDRQLGPQALARAALTYLAEPADPALGALLEICEPAEVLAAIKADMLPRTGPGCGDSPASRRALERALGRWRIRLPICPATGRSRPPAATASVWSAPQTPSGPAAWTSSARPARTRSGCAAGLTWGWPACARCPSWDHAPPPDTGRTWPARSPPTSPSKVGWSYQAGRTASMPPRTAACWLPGPSRSRSWVRGVDYPTRRATRTYSRISPRVVVSRSAAVPPGCGSSCTRMLRHAAIPDHPCTLGTHDIAGYCHQLAPSCASQAGLSSSG
jgi:hypothetical protein